MDIIKKLKNIPVKKNKALKPVLDLIFPPLCLTCGVILSTSRNIDICELCWQKITHIEEPYCSKCGIPFSNYGGDSHLCGFCLQKRPLFTLARSALLYEDVVAKLIGNFKYNGDWSGLRSLLFLTKKSAAFLTLSTPDLIIPVPLHNERLKERGFNQSLILAKKIFPDDKAKIVCNLVRNKNTVPQQGLNGLERRKNIKKAFSVNSPQEIKGNNICLVDDVYTTGTTVNECAKSLLKAGAKTVSIFTIAVVKPK